MLISSATLKARVNPSSETIFCGDLCCLYCQILARDPLGRLVIIQASSTSDQLVRTIVQRLVRAILLEAAVATEREALAQNVSEAAARRRIVVLPHQSYSDYLRLGRAVCSHSQCHRLTLLLAHNTATKMRIRRNRRSFGWTVVRLSCGRRVWLPESRRT